jgi:glycosyltransferase involved in cell wall biosynthesis
MGVPSPNVAIIPEAVDTSLFDPYSPDIKREGFATCSEEASASSFPADDIAFKVNEKKRFKFLSIFKWEYRKGWDILLDAYWSAFAADDLVVLQLRTYVPSFDHGTRNITARIEEYAKQRFDKELHELAPIAIISGYEERAVMAEARGIVEAFEVVNNGDINQKLKSNTSYNRESNRALSRVDIRNLLAAADAFVLPTRGEGWGLPIAEAMSMALPVIVTDCQGPNAYANSSNAYIIPVLEGSDYQGFVNVDKQALINILVEVVSEYRSTAHSCIPASMNTEGSECCWKPTLKGERARKTMQEISAEYVVQEMAVRIRALANLRGWNNL